MEAIYDARKLRKVMRRTFLMTIPVQLVEAFPLWLSTWLSRQPTIGGDGWESNPPRTPQQRPANGFEDRGRHQPPNIPSAGYISARVKASERASWIIAIAAIVVLPAIFMFLVTTFLFAFSSGQSRMVAVVNTVDLVVVALGVVVAAVTWRWRSAPTAIKVTAAVTGASWFLAVLVELVLSFFLGA